MKLKIKDNEFTILSNGTNITQNLAQLLILSSDPTLIDSLFQEEEVFYIMVTEDSDYVEYQNIYSVDYTQLRHNVETGIYYNEETQQFEKEYQDVVTVYMTK